MERLSRHACHVRCRALAWTISASRPLMLGGVDGANGPYCKANRLAATTHVERYSTLPTRDF